MNEKQTITLLFLSGVMLSLGMLSLYLNSAPGEPLVVDAWTGASTVKISPGLPVKKEISLLDIAKGNPNILKSPPKKFSDFYKVGFSAKGISQEEFDYGRRSFPSGHSSSSFALGTFTALYFFDLGTTLYAQNQ